MSKFNPDLQYRCTFIRGKSLSSMDDLLPIYAKILEEICPIPVKDFRERFNRELKKHLKNVEKTVNNHRTENVEKILGMYYEKDQIIYLSPRTVFFLNNNDQPAFFKSLCYKFQQPNGSQKLSTIREKVENEVNIKPFHFVIALLDHAAKQKVVLTRDEVAYFALGSLEVLQGKISVSEVFYEIMKQRKNGVEKKVEFEDKATSYSIQHINEQLDYLTFANLIRKDKVYVWLNRKESVAIKIFIEDLSRPLHFNILQYALEEKGITGIIQRDWQEYYGDINVKLYQQFTTKVESLQAEPNLKEDEPELQKDKSFQQLVEPEILQQTTTELGDEGEDFVLKMEREVVRAFNPRLVNKVNHHGKMKGLGYDITSIQAGRDHENPEFMRFIEVKSTKRVHPPKFDKSKDSITLTRNEWVAAEQNLSHYYIYRVYFTSQGVFVNIIQNPVKKNKEGLIYAVPTHYRVELNDEGFDQRLIINRE